MPPGSRYWGWWFARPWWCQGYLSLANSVNPVLFSCPTQYTCKYRYTLLDVIDGLLHLSYFIISLHLQHYIITHFPTLIFQILPKYLKIMLNDSHGPQYQAKRGAKNDLTGCPPLPLGRVKKGSKVDPPKDPCPPSPVPGVSSAPLTSHLVIDFCNIRGLSSNFSSVEHHLVRV